MRHCLGEKILNDITVIRDIRQRPVADSRINVSIENRPVISLGPFCYGLAVQPRGGSVGEPLTAGPVVHEDLSPHVMVGLDLEVVRFLAGPETALTLLAVHPEPHRVGLVLVLAPDDHGHLRPPDFCLTWVSILGL